MTSRTSRTSRRRRYDPGANRQGQGNNTGNIGHQGGNEQGGNEQGTVAVLLLLLTPALLALGGLVLDGGTALAARQRSADLAEQAARAGADRLDISTLRATGLGQLDQAAARAVACQYVRTVEPDATCTATISTTPTGQQIRVHVRTRTSTVLLGLIGVNTLHSDGTATAQAVTGISHEDRGFGEPDRLGGLR
jgi:Flp pilus assembly protein TadG